ncbi:hypothetical protein BD311DRAFT_310972 [Dichomitus squalens]|uniref:F-box domain-containing protein n=1 Tax=Dichomitus squalens TaxID=114155 RepID=A0A4Q9MQT4_9APHY|nr:hypothetical protein BD311DRAFT_310972 [Dichomitus squalens]
MPRLPRDIVYEVIDWVAITSPDSLLDCALVSRQWRPRAIYHLARIYRHRISTSDALYVYLQRIKLYPCLGRLATTLEIAPDLEANGLTASYIPFHHLSSSRLCNLRRLTLGGTLRWI